MSFFKKITSIPAIASDDDERIIKIKASIEKNKKIGNVRLINEDPDVINWLINQGFLIIPKQFNSFHVTECRDCSNGRRRIPHVCEPRHSIPITQNGLFVSWPIENLR